MALDVTREINTWAKQLSHIPAEPASRSSPKAVAPQKWAAPLTGRLCLITPLRRQHWQPSGRALLSREAWRRGEENVPRDAPKPHGWQVADSYLWDSDSYRAYLYGTPVHLFYLVLPPWQSFPPLFVSPVTGFKRMAGVCSPQSEAAGGVFPKPFIP